MTTFGEVSISSVPSYVTQSSNCLAILDPSKYAKPLHIIIEFLRNSIFNHALTMTKEVPMRILNLAFSTTTVQRTDDLVSFEIEGGRKLTISKTNFGKLLKLPTYEAYVTPTSQDLINMFNEMGHEPYMTMVCEFKKSKLPAQWSLLFGIILRGLTSRTVGLDAANKEVVSIMYGLYKGVNVDYITILWNEFIESVNHSKRATEVSSHRFWASIVSSAYEYHQIPFDTKEEPKAVIHQISVITKVSNQSHYSFIGQVPNEMLRVIPADSKILEEYRKTLVIPYPVRPIPEGDTPTKTTKIGYLKKKAAKTTKGGSLKRKDRGSTSKPDKREKSKRIRRDKVVKKKIIMINEEEEEDEEFCGDPVPESEETTSEPEVQIPIYELNQVSEPSVSEPLTQTSEPQSGAQVFEEQRKSCFDDIYLHSDSNTQTDPRISFQEVKWSIPFPRAAFSNDYPVVDEPDVVMFSETEGTHPFYVDVTEAELELTKLCEADIDSDELPGDNDNGLMTKKDFKKLNRKLNVLLRSVDYSEAQSNKLKEQERIIDEMTKKQAEQSKKIDELLTSFETFNTPTNLQSSLHSKELKELWFMEMSKFTHKVQDDNIALNKKFEKIVENLEKQQEYLNKGVNKSLNEAEQREICLQAALSQALSHIKYLEPYTNVCDPNVLGKTLESTWKNMTENLSKKIETQLAPIVHGIQVFVDQLPGGVPEVSMAPSQGEEKGIQISLPITISGTEAPIKTSFTKGISIGMTTPISTSSTVVTTTTTQFSSLQPSGKGKGVLVELTVEERKQKIAEERKKELVVFDEEFAKKNQEELSKEVRKEEERKCIELVRELCFSERISFELVPKESYDTINSLELQLDLPLSPRAFSYPIMNTQIDESLTDQSYSERLIRFHALVGKPQKQIWCVKGIRRLASIKKVDTFENVFQNFEFEVVRNLADDVHFTLADFPNMNPYDIVVLYTILGKIGSKKNTTTTLATSSVETFLIFYYNDLAEKDLVLANAINKQILAPNRELDGISMMGDGAILLKPTLGVVYSVRVPSGGVKKLFFRMDQKEKFPSSIMFAIIQRVRLFQKNDDILRKQVIEMLSWWLKVREVMLELVPILFPKINKN